MNLKNLRAETNEKVKQAYFSLHDSLHTKSGIQKLERTLSNDIYEAEVQIQNTKNSAPELTEEYYRRRTILKRIADALAWIILDFNPLEIQGLSNNHSPGFMAGKQGYKPERLIVEGLTEISEIKSVIQCDITNILRITDVIAIKTDGQRLAIEAKGNKSGSGRATKQKNRAKKAIDFIDTGVLDNYIKNSMSLRTFEMPINYDHYWKELEYLSKEALIKGMAIKVLDDALAICVVDKSQYNQQGVHPKAQRVSQNQIMCTLGEHMSRDPQILPIKRYPLTLFPIERSLGLKFVLGDLDAVCVLNLDIMTKKFKAKGLDISRIENGEYVIELQHQKKLLIRDGWERILLELITIPNFIELMELTIQRIDDGSLDL